MITIAISKVRSPEPTASPNEGMDTCTRCTPGGAFGATHVRVVEPSPLSTATTEAHG